MTDIQGEPVDPIRIAELEHRAEGYRLALEATGDAVWDWDLVQNRLIPSEGALAMLGYAQGEIPDCFDDWERLLDPLDLERSREMVSRMLKDPTVRYDLTVRLRRRDGTQLWVRIRGRVVASDGSGRAVRMIAVGTDVQREKELESELEKLAHVARLTTNHVLVCDREFRIEWANDALLADHQYRLEELLGRIPHEILGRSSRTAEDMEGLLARARAGIGGGGETVSYRKDGTAFRALVHYRPRFDSSGAFAGFIGVGHDVTEQRRFEEALREAADHLREAERIAGVGSFSFRPDTGRIDWSDMLFSIFGRNPVLGPPSLDEYLAYLRPADRERLGAAVSRTLETAEPFLLQHALDRPDGSVAILECRAELRRDAAGPGVLHGTAQDVTDRERTHAELRRINDVLRDAHRLARLGSWDYNATTGVLTWSPELFEIRRRDPARGQPSIEELVARFRPEDRDPISEGFRRSLETGAGFEIRYPVINEDGSESCLLTIGHPVRDERGTIVGLHGVTQDVTDSERIQAELARARDAAEAANRSKSIFLANVSHEIRTPMNAVLGLTDLMLRDARSAPIRPYLEQVHRSASSLLELLSDILEHSRLEVAGPVPVEGAFAPVELLRHVEDVLGLEAERKGLKFTTRLDEGLPAHLFGDVTRLHQILVNLVSNAIKFTETGGVEVRLQGLEGPGIPPLFRMEVSDTGIGIDPALTSQLFEPFFQADSSPARRHGGVGLGLSIVRQIVDRLGGTVDCVSRHGGGSLFRVALPLRTPPLGETRSVAASGGLRVAEAADPAGLAGLSVLVVEDDDVSRLVACGILSHLGARHTSAASAAQALRLIGSESFDVVLVDLQMPEMSGLELARTLRDAGLAGRPPLIALSANAMAEDVAAARDAGMLGLIPKPVSVEQMYERLRPFVPAASPR